VENTILHKLLKWIVASSVSLLVLPISVFIIIFSLYPDLVTVDGFRLFKLKSYYDICDQSKTNNCKIEDYYISDDITQKEDTAITQIVLLDRTASTKIDSVYYNNFKKSLKSFLLEPSVPFISDNNVNKFDSLKYINDLLYLSCIKSLYKFNYLDLIHGKSIFYMYDGTKGKHIFIEGTIDALIDTIYNIKAIYDSKINYYTNLKTIINTIPEIIKEKHKFNLTFISDFYHDDSLNTASIGDCDLSKLRDIIGDNSINLIIIDHNKSKEDKYKKQNEFLNKYRNYFEGTSNDTVNHFFYIDLENYSDENYCDCDSELLEFEDLFKTNLHKLDKIKFEAPIKSPNGFEIAEAKLRFIDRKDNTPIKYKWKFESSFIDNNTVILYKTHDKSFRKYSYGAKYTDDVASNETLDLQIKTRPDIDFNYDDLKFCISYKDTITERKGNDSVITVKNYFQEFGIEVRKTQFSDEYKANLIKILNVFCFLLLITLIAGETLFVVNFIDFRTKLRLKPTFEEKIKPMLFYVLGILLLIGILSLTFCVVAMNSFLPILICIIIGLITLGKISILIPDIHHRLEYFINGIIPPVKSFIAHGYRLYVRFFYLILAILLYGGFFIISLIKYIKIR